MNTWLISMIVVAVIIVVLAVFMAIRQRKKQETPNCRVWLYLGICWIPIGIATKNPAFYIMGAAFVIISLLNKDKWREEKKWSELTPAERNLKIILLCVAAIMLIAALFFFFIRRRLFI